MAEPIQFDELLKALEDAGKATPGEGFTTSELSEHMNVTQKKALGVVRTAMKMGRLRSSRKTISDLAGRPQTVPSYVFVKLQKGK